MQEYPGVPGSENKYLYNGKELQDELNLDWYDYGARFYDPQIGRWHVIDLMVENNHYEWTPYAYVYNNPIALIDPFGLDSIYAKNFWGNVNYIGNDGKDDGNVYLVKGGTKKGVKNASENGVDFLFIVFPFGIDVVFCISKREKISNEQFIGTTADAGFFPMHEVAPQRTA